MKKLSIAILAIIYLGVSSGIAMNVHYCMGKISSIDLVHGKDKCGKCGMKKGSGGDCCKDEFKIVKLQDAHKLISGEVNFSVPVTILNNLSNSFNAGQVLAEANSPDNNNSPPEPSNVSLHILHCVFRI